MLASAGGFLKFWNVSNLLTTTQIFKSEDEVTRLAWNKDGQYIASIKANQQEVVIHAYSEQSSSKTSMFRTSEVPRCLQFANVASRYLAVADTSKTIMIWDLKTKTKKKSIQVPNGEIVKLAFSNSDSHIAAGTKNGTACIISNTHNTTTGPFDLFSEKSQVMDLKYSITSRSLIGVCAQNGDVSFVDSNAGKVVKMYTDVHSAPATCLAFSPINELCFLSVGYDKRINCYNANQKSHLSSHKMEDPLTAACFMADGRHIASGTITGQILMHDIRMLGTPLSSVKAYRKPVTDLKLQPARAEKTKRKAPLNAIKKPSQSRTPQKDISKENVEPSISSNCSSPDVSLLSPVRNTNNKHSVLKNFCTNSPSDLGKEMLNRSFKSQLSLEDSSNSFNDLMSPVRIDGLSSKKKETILAKNRAKQLSSDTSMTDAVLSPVRRDEDLQIVNKDLLNLSVQGSLPLDKLSDSHLVDLSQPCFQNLSQIEQESLVMETVHTEETCSAVDEKIVEQTIEEAVQERVQARDGGDPNEKATGLVTTEDLAALKSLMENHQQQTRMGFHSMHFQMLKSFLHLKKEFQTILSQHHSINDDLLEENERLREEIRQLKNIH